MKTLLTILLLLTAQLSFGQQDSSVKTYTVDDSDIHFLGRQILDRLALNVFKAVIDDELLVPYWNDSLLMIIDKKDLTEHLKGFLPKDKQGELTVDNIVQNYKGMWFSFDYTNTNNGLSYKLKGIGFGGDKQVNGIKLLETPMFWLSTEQISRLMQVYEFDWLNYFANNFILQTGGFKMNSIYYYPTQTSYIDLYWGLLWSEVKDTLILDYGVSYFMATKGYIEDKLYLKSNGFPITYLDSLLTKSFSLNDEKAITTYVEETIYFDMIVSPGDTIHSQQIKSYSDNDGFIDSVKFFYKDNKLFSVGFLIAHHAFDISRDEPNYLIHSGTVWVNPDELKKYMTPHQFNFLFTIAQELKRSNNEPFKPLLEVEY